MSSAPVPAIGEAPGAAASTAAASLDEGLLLARYLLGGVEVPPVALARYTAGCSVLFGETPDGDSALRFVLRHPWALSCLDAASGLLAPHSLLRRKLFLMLAILETLPQLAPVFAPRPSSRPGAILRLAGWGLSGGVKVLLGAPLLLLARKTR